MIESGSVSFVTEHVDIVKVALTFAIGYIVWSFRRGLNTFETAMKSLQDDLKAVVLQVTKLQTEHNMRTAMSQYCDLDSCAHKHRRSNDRPVEEFGD